MDLKCPCGEVLKTCLGMGTGSALRLKAVAQHLTRSPQDLRRLSPASLQDLPRICCQLLPGIWPESAQASAPKSCSRSPRHLPSVRPESACHLTSICPGPAQTLCTLPSSRNDLPQKLQDLAKGSKLSPARVPGLPRICPGPAPASAQDLSRICPCICPASVQELPSTCPRSAQQLTAALPSICPGTSKDLPSTCPGTSSQI